MQKIYFLFVFLCGSLLFPACKSLKNNTAEKDPVITLDFGEVKIVAKPVYKGSAEKIFALKHTRLDLKPNWQQHTLEGTAELEIAAYAYPQDTLMLDARSFRIQSVNLMADDAEKPLSYIYDKRKMLIALGKEFQPGENFKIRIKYIAEPEKQLADSLIKGISDQGLFFINPEEKDPYLPKQLWTQGEVRNNSAWFPTIDEPNQKFTQEIFLTVDSSLETLSNGSLIYSSINKDGTRTDYWQLTKPHSAYLAMIAAGNWYIEKDNWRDSIPVEYYVEPEYAPYAKLIFGNTPEMMEYYSKLLKMDFPWPKYSQLVVREFVSGAMENTTATVHFEPVQHDARAHLDETYESIISHELFHHWFGDLVTAEAWSDLALNESFATYGERLWDEHKYGEDAAAYGRQQDLDAYLAETIYTKEPIVNHFYNDAEDLFDRHRYEKGGLVLHMLRTVLGDDVFFAGMHNYLVENKYKNAEISQLRTAMEEASGKDLNWFFEQWFLKPGHPDLSIKQAYNKEQKSIVVKVEQGQKSNNVPIFKMPVEIDIYLPGKMLSQKVWLGKSTDSFSFALPEKPLLVDFDAQKFLLAQKVEIKPIQQWYYQFMQVKNYISRHEALQALSSHTALLSTDSLTQLLKKGLNDSFWHIRSRSIESLLPNTPASVQEKFADKIKKIASNDKNSRVRLSAYIYMQGRKAFSADAIYAQALQDSSYKVVAQAIHALRTYTPAKDSARLLRQLAPLQKYQNSDVLFALALVYATYPDTSQLAFFHRIPKFMRTTEYGRFADAYKQYMEKMPAAVILREKDFILNLAPKITDIWAKISYKSMLVTFAEKLRSIGSPEAKNTADMFTKTAENISFNMEHE